MNERILWNRASTVCEASESEEEPEFDPEVTCLQLSAERPTARAKPKASPKPARKQTKWGRRGDRMRGYALRPHMYSHGENRG